MQTLTIKLVFLIGGILLLVSCSKDDDSQAIPMEFTELQYQKDYELLPGDTLNISPSLSNVAEDVNYLWTLNGIDIGSTQNLSYTAQEPGTFSLEFKAMAYNHSLIRTYRVSVIDPYDLYSRPKTQSSSEFISEIIEYKPAPGQYINKNFGSTEAAESIIGGKTNILSLGAWGGYVEFSFDHTIENREEDKDFVIYGNAMNGHSEPGIVQVSFDENGNGLPDDTWYELAGSAHQEEETLLDYEVTYNNPGTHANVPWTDNRETQDSILVNSFNTQNYYPLFIQEEKAVSFNGTRVYPVINQEGFVSVDALEWGYVDNFDENYDTYGGNAMEIDWAVDDQMNAVKLRGIDFVRVYTGALGNAGWLGEISTEIKGASDLSMVE
ncbi:hypothetical protein APR41_17330 [Salegentibacter salinarum]|uniref:Uncharacterized protein n=1 Tax=Salegentibacter salinarum TaxID=447422 RepID=A0A2N0TVU5_9FLAO|nr:PKD-like domain-containing protein [Salegentibacter salinarum]PKD18885.1 hypothetical protein APR41_17330 [Salegentibacter salinarum]SKB89064.1 PKD-like domain-containing protein [Salegentibacter salinarum]